MSTSHPVFAGSCFCKAVTYTSTALPDEICNCHCLTCRKLSGGPFLPFAVLPIKNITFILAANTANNASTTTGASPSQHTERQELHATDLPTSPKTMNALHIFAFSTKALRASCTLCHSPIAMWYGTNPQSISVTVGTIDEHSFEAGREEAAKVLRAREEIFWGEKACWWDREETAGLERSERFTGGWEP